MVDDTSPGPRYDPCWPWWVGTVFRFSPPSPHYERQRWCDAVLQHEIIQDFVCFVRGRTEGHRPPHRFLERIGERAHWFLLRLTLVALDIYESPEALWPLPQPRLQGVMTSYEWVVGLDLDAEQENPPLFVPLGLMLSRLAPVSSKPIAQFVALWLAYCVLPVCARYGGPDTWTGLDQMMNPLSQL